MNRVDVLSDSTSMLHDRVMHLESDLLKLSVGLIALTLAVAILAKDKNVRRV